MTSDAGGGAAALREASHRLIDDVARWLGALDRSAGGSLDAKRACR